MDATFDSILFLGTYVGFGALQRIAIIASRFTGAGSRTAFQTILPRFSSVASRVASLAYPLSLAIVVTSLIDLFMTRMLFRSGPDALNGVDAGSAFFLSVVGRINLTLEQFLLFAFVGSVVIGLLWREAQAPRISGLTLLAVVACSAALYAPLAPDQAWAVSLMLFVVTGAAVTIIAYQYLSSRRGVPRRLGLSLAVFLGSLVLSFIFPLYYRIYYLMGAINLAALPFPLEVYLLGVFCVIATTLAAFAYAVQAPSPGFGLGPRNALKTMFLPTILVVPTLYEFLTSFFALQIFGMVLTMSTDLAISHNVIEMLIVAFWFLLAAILLLVFKGRHSKDSMLGQQAMGLVLLLSTTMLFNYPYYLMLGLSGVILICIPLSDSDRKVSPTVSR